MRTLILLLLVFSGFYSCVSRAVNQDPTPGARVNYNDPYTMIGEGQALLKEGDLVTRLNQDPTSQFIKNLSRHDKRYSHAGIVLYENGYPFIYHIISGEENPDEKLRKDSLGRFCDPRKNTAYGLFRYEMNAGEIKNLKELIHKWYAKGVRFDLAFDLKTDNRMYCSEMISKALSRITGKRISIETTQPTATEARLFSTYSHVPFAYASSLQVVSIDNLYTNRFCHLIKEFNYKIYR
jgi:hypothetical protein